MSVKLPEEFLDVLKVLEFGAQKYDPEGWLQKDGYSMDTKSQAGSMQRHLSKALYGDVMGNKVDRESGLHHALHLACRALMLYTRYRRGIQHPDDNQINIKIQRGMDDSRASRVKPYRAGRHVPEGDFYVED